MEVNVEGVYFGDGSVYECTSAVFSKLNIKMTFGNSDDGETKSVLILKKDIIDLKASECCPFPVICLKLKDNECKKLGELLSLEEKGVNFNSRSKNLGEAWMRIYYNFATFEVPKFLATNYIEKKNFFGEEELHQLVRLPANKKLLSCLVTTLQERVKRLKRGEFELQLCPQSNAVIVCSEDIFLAKKFMNYVSNVTEGKAVKGKDVEVKIEPEAFTGRDVKQMMDSYKSCLVCVTCKEQAILKCKGCMVSRYCSQTCQDEDWSKHKEQCSLLLVEGKKRKVQECLVMKELVLFIGNNLKLYHWDKKILYNVWEKKFTRMVNLKARESMGLKKKVCV